MRNNIAGLASESQQEIELMVKDIQTGRTVNGDIYQRLAVQDREGNAATLLRFDEQLTMESPAVCRMLVEAYTYNGRPSYKVLRSEVLPGADLSAFCPKAEVDEAEAVREVNIYYKKIADKGLRRLVTEVLGKSMPGFQIKPLTASGAFARQSGILEATLKLLRMVEPAVSAFGLDADMMYAASLLYYIGSVDLVTDGYAPTEDDILTGEGAAAARRIIEAETVLKAGGVTEEMLPRRRVNVLLHILSARYDGMKSAVPESVALRDLGHMVRRTEEARILVKEAGSGTVAGGYGMRMLKV